MTETHATAGDIAWMLDELCEFPWSIDALSDLKRYVHVVNEFLPHAIAQQTVRLNARIKSELDPVAIGEFESELEVVQCDHLAVLPRLVWGGVLVATYSAFEFGLESIFNHWRAATGHSVFFKQEPKKDFLSSAETYAEEQIGVPLFSSLNLRGKIFDLKNLRNSFVHRGGRISTLAPKMSAKLAKRDHPGLILEIIEDHWIANAETVTFYLSTAESVIRPFGSAVSEKCLSRRRT